MLTAVARFEAKVDRSGDCWVWTGVRTDLGYGQFHYGGKTTKAHRAAWILANGAIPAGLCVLHSCDNPPCVRLDHLFLGTLSDNMRDCAAKGRLALQRENVHRRGLDNVRGKLTDLDVAVIRGLRGHYTAREMGGAFGVSDAHIRLLWRRVQRAHVQPLPLHQAKQHLAARSAA